MAALAIDTTAVIDLQGSRPIDGIAGEAFPQNAIVYRKTSDGRIYKALANADATSALAGVAMNAAAAAGTPVKVAQKGRITGITAVTKGLYYVLSPGTAGYINPSADLTTTNRNALVGVADSATSLLINVYNWVVTL